MKITATITDQGIKREVDFQGATLPDGRSIQRILDESEILKQQIKKLAKENDTSINRIKELSEENETSKHQIKELNEERSLLARYVHNKSLRKILEWLLRIFAIIGAIGTILWVLSSLHL